ncbi:MAG: peptidoglycan DD-metalloendopeptidase family protein [Deltaproteobacteria bacterium]|nr:peptidoglycan DD-metalloendopeptidase family protein [Deltaproteobacteria bacterium]
MFSFSGCAAHVKRAHHGGGVYHTVGKGETLWRICRAYGVSLQEVAEINNIKDPTDIAAGMRVFIPGARSVKKVVPYSPDGRKRDSEGVVEAEDGGAEERPVVEKGRFQWPVKGEVISSFGIRNGVMHDGIDIRADEGAPIAAADEGEVVFESASMRGYGKIVILSHKDGFFTVYAHNKENLVKRGGKVSIGDIIARVGDTGNATVSHLHFEVRRGKSTRNPLFFLP